MFFVGETPGRSLVPGRWKPDVLLQTTQLQRRLRNLAPKRWEHWELTEEEWITRIWIMMDR